MAQLVALYFGAEDWDVFVVEGLTRGVLDRKANTCDVLGRQLPQWERAEMLPGVKHGERLRLANSLKGLSKERRREVFRERARHSGWTAEMLP